MLVKTVLNRLVRFKSFVLGNVFFEKREGEEAVIVEITPRKGGRPVCQECGRKGPGYDVQPARTFQYLPLFDYKVFFLYAPRRVNCSLHGIHVEALPWGSGKEHLTNDYKLFLGRWARRLSWSETARVFRTSWDSVYRAVSYMVDYGLKHRSLEGITQLGIDEIAVFKGHKYLTLVYQLNAGVRRLLWCGTDRKTDTLLTFFKEFSPERCARLEYICTDMWAPFLDAIRQCAPEALNILDRFHIMKKFGEAIDQIRRDEHKAFKAEGQSVLEKARWALLKRPENLTENQTARLADLLKLNIQSVKAYLLREDFQRFWEFKHASVAGRFLDSWCKRTMRTKLEPMKKVARMLQNHKPLIMNWFAAKGTLSSGAVEGLNLKAKLTMRKAFGFRSTDSLKIALYHTLGNLPDPPGTHGFS